MFDAQTTFRRGFILLAAALAFSSLIFETHEARAQSGEAATDLSLYGGYMLPNQIDGVTEIVPLVGGRYAFGFPSGAIEAYGENAHAVGVDWTSFGLSLRGEIPVMPGVTGLIYGGPSFHWYVPANDTARHTDYGVHAGVAGLMLVSDTLWLRSDLRFLGNPGTALYLLFGLMFRAPGSK